MSRDAIFSRIRAAASSPARPPQTHTIPASLVTTGADVLPRFRAMAEAKGVTVIETGDIHALPAAIARAVPDRETPIRLNDPTLATFRWSDAGLETSRGPAEPNDRVALSRAFAAIAETGTLLLTSGPENPATLAFLPETHLVAVDRAAIAGTYEDALARLRQSYGANLPRTLNFISGASRTGDIGGRLVHGAHGPRRLVVFVV